MIGKAHMNTIGKILLEHGVNPKTAEIVKEQFEQELPENIVCDYGIGRK